MKRSREMHGYFRHFVLLFLFFLLFLACNSEVVGICHNPCQEIAFCNSPEMTIGFPTTKKGVIQFSPFS